MNFKALEEKKEVHLLNRESLRVNGVLKMHSLDSNIFDFDSVFLSSKRFFNSSVIASNPGFSSKANIFFL